ncbi:Aspartate--tRNA ligase, mitochondrial [Cyberlindnera fabianii]|uniref:Aspartate--tRNA ligase, mitochondrial n=1 Tax=Cyberlindnera fabianii TaxID=36022 RepID=A0A1V2L9H5_CYBFA|nr:Aspartate--tRNA ligase, mitochondrial [Cyberlindnera fabianii]
MKYEPRDINKSLDSFWGQEVTLSGWIDKKPKKLGKGIAFATLRDFNGHFTQVLARDDLADSLRSAQVEDCVAIKGRIMERHALKGDETTKRWDLVVSEYTILNQSSEINAQLESLRSTPNEFPPQYRFLQLRLQFFQNALKKRALAAQVVRDSLISKSFTEIETPLLFKSTPEGAREFLVPTRRADRFYALPQSPQQYKQLLMASGIKNYFQLAKCFRDEDLRADRQPEFTQVDLEMSFADMKDVQDVVEGTVKRVWEEVNGEKIMTVEGDEGVRDGYLVHLTYEEALSKYGIDKPDLRSTVVIENLSGLATAKEDMAFPEFEVCVLRGAMFKDGKKKKLPGKLFDDAEYRNRKPIIIPIKTQEDVDNYLEKFSPIADIHEPAAIRSKLNIQIGDVIAGSTRATLSYENPTPLGRFRQLAISEFPNQWQRDASFVGAWVEDFPLFSPQELETESKTAYPQYDLNTLQSTHHPFTMAKPEHYDLLATDPLSVKGEHYDLVVNGVELGGGSRRVHDSELQRYIFTEILRVPDPDRLFGHLLHALSMGCPPHAGLALGFDRMCAMLIGSSSIRDVVAFPKTQNGTDMVVESPSEVSDEVLKAYHVKKLVD